MKPIEKEDLISAVARLKSKIGHPSKSQINEQLELFFEKVTNRPSKVPKLALPTVERFELFLLENIVRCEANNNYTRVFIKDRNSLLVSADTLS